MQPAALAIGHLRPSSREEVVVQLLLGVVAVLVVVVGVPRVGITTIKRIGTAKGIQLLMLLLCLLCLCCFFFWLRLWLFLSCFVADVVNDDDHLAVCP